MNIIDFISVLLRNRSYLNKKPKKPNKNYLKKPLKKLLFSTYFPSNAS